MKKRLLSLVLMVVCVSFEAFADINISAVTINGKNGYAITGSEGTWVAGDLAKLLEVSYSGNVTLNGAAVSNLASVVADIRSAEAVRIGGGSEALNDDDLKALDYLNALYLDMDKATFFEDVSNNVKTTAESIKSKAHYIALPFDTSVEEMMGMRPNNQNLLAVGTTDSETHKEFTGFSFIRAGEIYNICQMKMIEGIYEPQNEYDAIIGKTELTKLTLGGILDDRDCSTNSQDHNWAFDEGILGVEYSIAGCPEHPQPNYIAPSNFNNNQAVSPWKGNLPIELDFTWAKFANVGDLAVVSNQVTKLALPIDEDFTVIPPYMFANLTKLEEIVIPNNIITIKDAAFVNNIGESNLKDIFIGNGIKTIGNCAFSVKEGTNYKVETIHFAAGISDVKILSRAFTNLLGIKHLVLPEGIVSIGEECFLRASTLESVRFPNTLKYIGKNAFRQTGLTSITIPKNVKVIDHGAFSLCSITDIYLMAETLEQLPFIYGSEFATIENLNPLAQEAYSSFGANSISANNSSPSTTSGWPNEIMDEYATYTTAEADEAYRWSIAKGNTVACLHYNEALRYFIDYNPWYDVNGQNVKPKPGAIVTDPNTYLEKEYLTDTYYYKDAEGKTIPVCNAGDYIRANESAYYDYQTGVTYSHEAGNEIVSGYSNGCVSQTGEYYNPETGELNWTTDAQYNTTVDGTTYIYKVLTKEAWRQFVFKRGDATNPEIVLKKEYQNIWYTMCFPFGLTDEQLEGAFNANYNIADFSGVEVKKEMRTSMVKKLDGEGNVVTDEQGNAVLESIQYPFYNLILHFNTIAKAKYFDYDYNEYTRVPNSQSTGKTGDGVVYTTYIYEDADGNQYKNLTGTFSTKAYAKNGQQDNGVRYIDGYLAWPGHPYMIHPNIGTKEGHPAEACYLSGLKYFPLGKTQLKDKGQDVDVLSWYELCRINARTIDLGSGKGYTGDVINEANETDYNFMQKAYYDTDPTLYDQFPEQTYTFIGNCDEYTEDAPAYPSMGNRPAEPEYLTKIEAPTVVENPYPNLVDPATKYSEEFVTFYNTNDHTWFNINNASIQLDIPWGEIIATYTKEQLFGGNYCYNPNYQTWIDYIGGNTWTDEQYQAVLDLCLNYPTDVAAYNEAINSSQYAAYLAYLDAYAAYETAYNTYIAEHPGATPENIVAYNATVDPTNTSLKTQYDKDVEKWEKECDAKVAQWKEEVQNYKVQIPLNSYFLSRLKSEYYTHFFRNVAVGKKNPWNQYTAIVNPSQDALDGIETLIGGVVTEETSSKAFNFVIDTPFGPDTYTEENGTVDAIKEVVEQAISKGEDVKYMNVVYSIDGKEMGRDMQSLSGLPTGIYIVNGKKYFVK